MLNEAPPFLEGFPILNYQNRGASRIHLDGEPSIAVTHYAGLVRSRSSGIAISWRLQRHGQTCLPQLFNILCDPFSSTRRF